MPKDKGTLLIRSVEDELRASNRDDSKEQGIIEGYFCRWGQVDSYNTRFQKGCFAKSINERMNKIVIRNSHGNPIGKPLEIREDDVGAFFSGQMSLEVQEAREAFILVRDSIVTGLSFGFQNVKDKIETDGVRTYTEVKLLEISPTWLPAGDDSRITNVRAVDFSESVMENMGPLLWGSIMNTVDDIWWSWVFDDFDNAEAVAKIDEALSAFRNSYVEFASKWAQAFGNEGTDDNLRSSPVNELQQAVAVSLRSAKQSAEQFMTENKISQKDFELLRRGKHVADLNVAAALPAELRTLNNQLRAASIENNFTELRTMMSSGELKRSNALLSLCGTIEPTQTKEAELRSSTEILSALKKLNGED